MNDAVSLELPMLGPDGHDPFWDDLRPGSYYDRRGNLISMRDWARLGQFAAGYRRVAEATVGDYWVSTVWLGIDHGWGEGGKPVIFETMVFNQATDESDLDMERYQTEEDALEGHRRIVEKVRLIMEATSA